LPLLQKGEKLSMPHSRPLPSIGRNCHELRIRDKGRTWRIVYHIDDDTVIILEVFAKKTEQTPNHVVKGWEIRLNKYLNE